MTVLELTGLPPRRGAAPAAIEATERRLGATLSADHRAFLMQSDGLEGFVGPNAYLMLWSAHEIAELNEGYATAEFAPGLILVGTDGGDTGYGILERGGLRRYVRVPLVGMSVDSAESMGNTLVDLVRRVQRRSAGGSQA